MSTNVGGLARLRRASRTIVQMARVVGKASARQKVGVTENATGTNVDVRAELQVLCDEDRNKTGYYKYTFQNGDWYEGNWDSGALCGQGTFHYHSGNIYTGEWLNNKRHGKGKFENNVAKTTYEGEWRTDLRHGTGTSVDKDGNRYEGLWDDGSMCGKGAYRFTNGDRYDGHMMNNDFSGIGTFHYANGDKYEGEWTEGQQNGRGTFHYQDLGHKYIGQWVNDKKHGHGKYHGSDFEYDGEWRNDAMNGNGTYTYATGDKYVGEWRDDNEHGRGTYYFGDGSKFEGEWICGKRNGKGVFTATDGAKYDGDWENNQKIGHGVYYYPNGDKYDGDWADDQMNGEGVYTYKNGKAYNVVYKNGACVKKTAIAGTGPKKEEEAPPTPPPPPAPAPKPTPPTQEQQAQKLTPAPPKVPPTRPRPASAEQLSVQQQAELKAGKILETARINQLQLMQSLEDPEPDPAVAQAARDSVKELMAALGTPISDIMKEEASSLSDQIAELLHMWDEIMGDLGDSQSDRSLRLAEMRRKEEEERRRKQHKDKLADQKSETRSKLEQLKEKRRLDKLAKDEQERIEEQLAEQRRKRMAALNNDDFRREVAQKEEQYLKEINRLKLELRSRPTQAAEQLRAQIEAETKRRLELEKGKAEDQIRQEVEERIRKEIKPEDLLAAKEAELKEQEEKQMAEKEEEIKRREEKLRKRTEEVRNDCQRQLQEAQKELEEQLSIQKGGLSDQAKREYELKMEKMAEQLDGINKAANSLDYEVASDKDIAEVGRLRDLYQKELRQRKEIYNQLIDLKGAVRVFVRVAPQPGEDALKFLNSETVVLGFHRDDFKARTFEFDRAFPPDADVDEIMEDAVPLVSSVADGFNVGIFAYGATGTGKTYTMMGEGANTMGLYKAAVNELFRIINGKKDEQDSEVKVGILEVYGETVKDLQKGSTLSNVSFNDGVTTIDGIQKVTLKNPAEIQPLLSKAVEKRTPGKEDRSHMVVLVYVAVTNKDSGKTTESKMALVDCAGCEKLPSKDSSDAQGITRALGSLGDCLAANSQKKGKDANFGGSMLTRVVQDCISGKAKTLIFATITHTPAALEQSQLTLMYAARCSGREEEEKKKKKG